MFIEAQIKFIRKVSSSNQNLFENRHSLSTPVSKLKWTAKPFEFVELSKALYYTPCFNNGEINFSELFDNLSELFGISVLYPHAIYMKMQNRVQDRTLFLSRLKENLERDMQKKIKRGCYPIKFSFYALFSFDTTHLLFFCYSKMFLGF
ncbi:RteC domain-containing protein [Petrimonas sulfuriphila]|uniref:RteC domain-containing protein n=1 Tax=Petrimonas sulfuriphila TaxID=285070 RepID=UPI003EBDF3A8